MESTTIIQSLLSNKEFTFVNNKYLQHYVNLIIKCKNENRKKLKQTDSSFIYYESHHILPESFEGPNTKDNLVLFTVKEHLFAHHLLVKCTSEKAKGKMVYALHRFFNGNKNQRQIGKNFVRLYERNKIEHAKNVSQQFSGEKNPNWKKNFSESTRKKMRDAWTDTRKEKHSKSRSGSGNPLFGKKDSIETRNKKIKAAENRLPISDETRHLLSKSKIKEKNPSYIPVSEKIKNDVLSFRKNNISYENIRILIENKYGIKYSRVKIQNILRYSRP
jgi:hypothetical protein